MRDRCDNTICVGETDQITQPATVSQELRDNSITLQSENALTPTVASGGISMDVKEGQPLNV